MADCASAAASAPERVCRVQRVQRETFGRVLELTEPVRAGDNIVVEPPCVKWSRSISDDLTPENLSAVYKSLTDEQREFVATLSGNVEKTEHPMSKLLPPEIDHFRRAMLVNAHAYGTGTSDETAFFQHISFAPHSCSPCAQYCSVQRWGVGRLYALRDLAAGEMVTISYIPPSPGCLVLWPRWRRHYILEKYFAFTCKCARCSAEPVSEPSAGSLALVRGHDFWDERFTDREAFLAIAQRHIGACKNAPATDDAPFHQLRAFDLLREFHVNHFWQSPKGDMHLAPAIGAVADMFDLLPSDENVFACTGLTCLWSLGLQHKRDTGLKAVLQWLWFRLGAFVRFTWGTGDPEYWDLREAYGEHEADISLGKVIGALRAVKACAACGAAGLLTLEPCASKLLRCSRCKAECYCSTACQRASWPKHKPHCKP